MPPQTPEDHPPHRYARAAGRATRAFLDASRRDAEVAGRAAREARATAERERRAAADAERERRAAAAAGPSTLLRTARWWWGAVTVLFALLTASFLVAGLSAPQAAAEGPVFGPEGYLLSDPLAGRTGQYVLAGLTGVLTVATGTGTVQLLRSRRGAAGLLTGIAVLVGVPLILRGHPLLIVIAAVLLAGAALLWLPPVRRRLR